MREYPSLTIGNSQGELAGDTSLVRVDFGVLSIKGDLVTFGVGEAKRVDASSRVAPSDVLAIDRLIAGDDGQCEWLGFSAASDGNGGGCKSGGDGELHFDKK